MKFILAICLFLFLFLSCKTNSPSVSSTPADPQMNPGSCKIEGSIVEVIASNSQDTSDICFKYSCEAIVHVQRIMHCGSSATITPDEKGEIKVHFPNSLNPIDSVSQTASKKGLKKGSVFSAIVETRLAPGDKTNYVIYIYEIR